MTTTLMGQGFLDYMIPATPLIDFFRYVTGMLGVLVFCSGLVQWLRRCGSPWSVVGFTAAGLLTALQQFDALDEPFHPWRLPLLVVVNVCGIVYLYRLSETCPHHHGGVR